MRWERGFCSCFCGCFDFDFGYRWKVIVIVLARSGTLLRGSQSLESGSILIRRVGIIGLGP